MNALVLATTRVLRGKVGRVELEAAVPHTSLVAVERAVARLRKAGILDGGKGGVYFKDAPWRPQIEKLFDGYLRLRPELRDQIRVRSKVKKQTREGRYAEGMFGYATTERILTALAVHGPMTRTELRSITMFMHQNKTLTPLVQAGVLAEERHPDGRGGSRVVVSLNAACPIYPEMRATLLALAEQSATVVRDLSDPRADYDVEAMFDTAPLFWALLMMNALGEIDVASLNRLRPQHANFTLHGQMHWLLDEGITTVRRQGLVLYYSLNTDHRAYKHLKRLLDRIAKSWPDLVEAAAFNDEMKPERRLTQDRNAKKRRRSR